MEEQRLEAYLNLIQALYNCSSGEEIGATLQANSEWVDGGLVQVVEQVAAWLTDKS